MDDEKNIMLFFGGGSSMSNENRIEVEYRELVRSMICPCSAAGGYCMHVDYCATTTTTTTTTNLDETALSGHN
jgi:hypothetical protein